MKLDFPRQIIENSQILNLMKIRPVETQLSHADGQTVRHT